MLNQVLKRCIGLWINLVAAVHRGLLFLRMYQFGSCDYFGPGWIRFTDFLPCENQKHQTMFLH